MSFSSAAHSLSFHSRALARLAASLARTGIVSPAGGVRAAAATPGILARYRFTTARELEQGARACPDRLALIDDDGTLTYRQLRDQARTFARHLLSLNLDEIRLGVMARNGRGIIIPLGAKGLAGGSIFLLNIGSSAEQLAGVIAENRINVLVMDDEFVDRLPAGVNETTHVIIAHESGQADKAGRWPRLADIVRHPERVGHLRLPVLPRHGHIVLMSSGTTGTPKGIIRNEPTLPVVVASIMSTMPWRADQRVQLTASIFHTWGWACLNIALAARNTIVTRRVFDPVACLRDIQRYRLDGLLSSPVFYLRMVEADPDGAYDASSLRFIASSGHALSPSIVQRTIDRFGPILCNIYGSTELALAATATAEQIAADPTIGGQVASGTRLRILDRDGHEVPRGEVGEIYLTNSTALIGYTNPTIQSKRAQGLISIGDLGRIDADGNLHVVGRTDDMIIVGGENVHPQSVTEVLETMDGIRELHSAGVDDPETFARVAVWVVPEDSPAGKELTADKIREFVRANLADHSVPRDVHFLDLLPRNATGKVVPRQLPR